jgi:deoxyribodipyrimidine photo-lyase
MEHRVRQLNSGPPRLPAQYVLYWTQMNRRADSNHALAYAASRANELGLPLLVYEGLTCSYPYASDRFHAFILGGVSDQQRRMEKLGAGYFFYLRRRQSDPDDILYRLAADAALLVTDDYPTFIARRHNASVPGKIGIPYYVVDSSCIVPMSRHTKQEYAARTIRPKIHRMLVEHMRPVEKVALRHRFNAPKPGWHTDVPPAKFAALIASCDVDHSVAPSISFDGGRLAAERQLAEFLENRLRRYAGHRNSPSAHATSDLSPWLHFGQISALEIALAAEGYAEEHKLIATEFLEELIVRRELAFNFTRHCDNYDSLEALPEWVQKVLAEHDADSREFIYNYDEFAQARTHDELWNACQKEMLLRGKIHGYYRMYWGKKIIEWAASHAEALRIMIELHDRYAIDGRDPNTYTNILWCFGLHDRPWQRRDVFGTIRYMSLAGMERKTDVSGYLQEIAILERTGKDPFRVG